MLTYLLTYSGREGEKIELGSCVKVEVVVLGSPSLIRLMVSVEH